MLIRLSLSFIGVLALLGFAYSEPLTPAAPAPTVNENNSAPLAPSTPPAVAQQSQDSNLTKLTNAPMQFELLKSGQNKVIFATGMIVPETPAVFRKFLEDNKINAKGQVIAFNSNGGDLLAAIALGREIRQGKFATVVTSRANLSDMIDGSDHNANKSDHSSQNTDAAISENSNQVSLDQLNISAVKQEELDKPVCADACLIAFLGGYARKIGDGRVSFRTSRPPLDEAGTISGQELDIRKQQLTEIAYIYAYADEMHFDPSIAFIDWRNADAHVFTTSELKQYKLNFAPNLIDNWRLTPSEGGLKLKGKSHDGSLQFSFYCDDKNLTHIDISSVDSDLLSQAEYDKITNYLLFDQNIPASQATISVNAEKFNLNLTLGPIKPDDITNTDTHILGVSQELARTPLLKLDLENPERMKSYMRAALRNCL